MGRLRLACSRSTLLQRRSETAWSNFDENPASQEQVSPVIPPSTKSVSSFTLPPSLILPPPHPNSASSSALSLLFPFSSSSVTTLLCVVTSDFLLSSWNEDPLVPPQASEPWTPPSSSDPSTLPWLNWVPSVLTVHQAPRSSTLPLLLVFSFIPAPLWSSIEWLQPGLLRPCLHLDFTLAL
ncbi:hypothetical protein ROHU_026868 [Labeo rohita]|uniref:Uncharacterized protein n=1 Tax=Labeo rohita TaxID=84645 RepID=A0A498M990_LABRO|nr:hypothetical protein ROHU_026868 [Labeo rohita]